MKRKANILLRLYKRRVIDPARRKARWEPMDTGELPDLHPAARITKRLGRLPRNQPPCLGSSRSTDQWGRWG